MTTGISDALASVEREERNVRLEAGSVIKTSREGSKSSSGSKTSSGGKIVSANKRVLTSKWSRSGAFDRGGGGGV